MNDFFKSFTSMDLDGFFKSLQDAFHNLYMAIMVIIGAANIIK